MSLRHRLRILEQSQGANELSYVLTVADDGRPFALPPGKRLAPRYAVMPQHCESAEEWSRKYVPRASSRAPYVALDQFLQKWLRQHPGEVPWCH